MLQESWTEAGEAVWYENERTHTEASDEGDDRMVRFALRLKDADATEEEARFALLVEQRVAEYKEYFGRWCQKNPGSVSSITMWAVERLDELKGEVGDGCCLEGARER